MAGYFLRFTQSEFSSENVAMLLAIRELHKLGPADGKRATTMAQEICKEHIVVGAALEVNMPQSISNPLMAWLKASLTGETEGGDDVKTLVLMFSPVYELTFRNVNFDTFPRFRHTDYCVEMVTIHLKHFIIALKFRECAPARCAPALSM